MCGCGVGERERDCTCVTQMFNLGVFALVSSIQQDENMATARLLHPAGDYSRTSGLMPAVVQWSSFKQSALFRVQVLDS